MATLKIENETFGYSHRDKTTSRVIVSKRTSTCSKYNDRAICAHLVAACIISNTKIVGIKPKVWHWERESENSTKNAHCLLIVYIYYNQKQIY